jgi:pyruvate dehydrogenase E2 component (dihydrolipoamide acetyltransferase)
MATEIKMPQLSDTMSAGKILGWSKQEGDVVGRGEILAEVETDKANLEIECFHPGTLLKIVVPLGSEAKVGEVIAYIGEPGEKIANGTAKQPASEPEKVSASPVKIAANGKQEITEASRSEDTPAQGSETSDQQLKNGKSGHLKEGRIKISPLAKKLAEQAGVDPRSLTGSGPDGRIIKKDIEAAASATTVENATNQKSSSKPSKESSAQDRISSMNNVRNVAEGTQHSPSTSVGAKESAGSHSVGSGEVREMSKMRKTIAQRMQQSMNEAPHFYTTASIDMEAAVNLQQSLRSESGFEKLSINHLVIKAAARALRAEPRVNFSFRDGGIYEPASINIGMITALDNGLLIPVLHDVDRMSLQDIVFEARAALDRARAGRPSSADLSGGTFSISNMGMFDVENFTAIINPGQGAVLAVSSTKELPVVRNGQIAIGKQMKVTLSVDHRIIDGIMAANFLAAFKKALETPALLCLNP